MGRSCSKMCGCVRLRAGAVVSCGARRCRRARCDTPGTAHMAWRPSFKILKLALLTGKAEHCSEWWYLFAIPNSAFEAAAGTGHSSRSTGCHCCGGGCQANSRGAAWACYLLIGGVVVVKRPYVVRAGRFQAASTATGVTGLVLLSHR